ncbi:MAG TPA: hypothetical protein VFI31_01815 [Pirellulales bacterium]|nr:hypothetical protein [Pirellulales bacterium]
MNMANGGLLRYFKEHLHLYQQQAMQEEWKSEHETAMRCRDLEEFIGIGLSLFKLMKERSHTVQDAMARGSMACNAEVTQAFLEGYREWLKPCAAVESAIRWFESRNYQVEKAEEFRSAVRDISLHEFDVDSMIRAERDIHEGRGKPLAEAIGELQRHCQS